MGKFAALDAMMDDIDATLQELEHPTTARTRTPARLAPVPSPSPGHAHVPVTRMPRQHQPVSQSARQIMTQQQEQLRIQQQLLEIQSALLRQQQLNSAPPPAPNLNQFNYQQSVGVMYPRPLANSKSNSDGLNSYSASQVQQDQLMAYNKSLRSWTSDQTRRPSMFSHESTYSHDSDMHSLVSSDSSQVAGISGGGIFGKPSEKTESVTSSERKRGLFGFSKDSSSSSSSKKPVSQKDVVASLESIGF
ncbi:hypothetical protein HDU77_010940 [Chytriomyces hyalinus]|nr:hypothetical protein HDU77_010940 [Chytriomyces hyalinus]